MEAADLGNRAADCATDFELLDRTNAFELLVIAGKDCFSLAASEDASSDEGSHICKRRNSLLLVRIYL